MINIERITSPLHTTALFCYLFLMQMKDSPRSDSLGHLSIAMGSKIDDFKAKPMRFGCHKSVSVVLKSPK